MISLELIFSKSGNSQDKTTTDSTNNYFLTKSIDKEIKERGGEKNILILVHIQYPTLTFRP
jgi:hypothetical protein